MKITYDLDLEDEDDARIGYADMAFSGLREVTASVLFVLQHFPFVQYIPAWFPGAGFHRILAEANPPCAWMLDVPFSQVKAKVVEGCAPSEEAGPIAAELLRRMENSQSSAGEDEESEEQVARSVAALIVEGTWFTSTARDVLLNVGLIHRQLNLRWPRSEAVDAGRCSRGIDGTDRREVTPMSLRAEPRKGLIDIFCNIICGATRAKSPGDVVESLHGALIVCHFNISYEGSR